MLGSYERQWCCMCTAAATNVVEGALHCTDQGCPDGLRYLSPVYARDGRVVAMRSEHHPAIFSIPVHPWATPIPENLLGMVIVMHKGRHYAVNTSVGNATELPTPTQFYDAQGTPLPRNPAPPNQKQLHREAKALKASEAYMDMVPIIP